MEDLAKKIKEIPEPEFPAELHARIIRQLSWSRFRMPLTVMIILLILNIAVSGWFMILRMIDNDVFTFIKLMFSEFEFDSFFLATFADILYDVIPLGLTTVLAVNLVLVLVVVKIHSAFKKMSFYNGRTFS